MCLCPDPAGSAACPRRCARAGCTDPHGERTDCLLRPGVGSGLPCEAEPADACRSMFLFFWNRLGCLGSIVVSLLLTGLLLWLFNVF